jgi:hypothetical protein
VGGGGDAAIPAARRGGDGRRAGSNGAASAGATSGSPRNGGTVRSGWGGTDPAWADAAHGTGERPAIRPYTYRRPRADRRQLVGVALAVVLVLGVSLAIVGFTQGSTGSPTSSRATTTSVSPDGSSTTAGTPSTQPGSPGSTVVPTTTVPPDNGDDAGDSTGDQAGAAPEIGRFAATEQGLGTPCGAAQRRITLAWESTGATSAQLDGPGAPTNALPPNGQATACRDPGPPETYTLTVTGPGGTSFRTTTV